MFSKTNLPIPSALAPLVSEIEKRSDAGVKLAELALIMRDKIGQSDRVFLAMRARLIAPDDPTVWRITENLLQGVIPSWHWSMLNDHPRNQAYADAIAAQVTAGQTVLEIGTGTGILAIMAARAGADHVWAVERNKVLAKIATQNIAQNNLSDRITVICADAMELAQGQGVPTRCDCLIHELVSDDLLGESVLPIVAHARAHLLTKDAILLPERLMAWGRIVADFPAEPQDVGRPHGVDLGAMNLLRSVTRSALCDLSECDAMSDIHLLADYDLNGNFTDTGEHQVQLRCTKSGTMIGLEQWIGFQFPNGGTYSNADGANSHWAHLLHSVAPTNLSNAAEVSVIVKRLENLLIFHPEMP